MSVTKMIEDYKELRQVMMEHAESLDSLRSDDSKWIDDGCGGSEAANSDVADKEDFLEKALKQQSGLVFDAHIDISQLSSDIEDFLGKHSSIAQVWMNDAQDQLAAFFAEFGD